MRTVLRRTVLVATALGLALALGAACGGGAEYAVVGAPPVIGADLAIVIEKTDTGNFIVNLTAEYLSPPERLGSGLAYYVVWARTADQPAMRLGKLDYDPDSREGTMSATTTNRAFDIIVTAELSPDVAAPGSNIIFQQTCTAPE